jgi:glycosyltransferase involved in cell wall biosynthesis
MVALETHSFAILAYGDSPYLEDCVQSLLNQNVKSSVYISTSTPSEYIRAVASKYGLDICVNPEPPNIVTDWNFAIDQCKTEYLTLAHQDDIYYPAYTEKLLNAARKAGDALIAFCGYREIYSDRSPRVNTWFLFIKRVLLWPFLFGNTIRRSFFKKTILRFGCPVCCPSVMYHLAKAKPEFNPEYKNNLDWDAWLRLSGKPGSFIFLKDKLVAHRIHRDSETTKQIAGRGRYQEDLKMFNRIWPKPIAFVLAKLYRHSYKSNKI